MSYGLIPWGNGFWGLNVPPTIDPIKPSNINIVNVIPAPGSFNIIRNQSFTFTIKSIIQKQDGTSIPGFPISTSSIYIFLDNKLVVQGLTVNSNFTVNSTLNQDGVSLDFIVTPHYLFRDADVFTMQIYATDIYGTPSFPFWAGYVVIDTRPPLITPIYPLDGYTDVPIDLTLHFLINQLISPDIGLDPLTLNVTVDNIPAVINGIIQSPFDGIYSAINLPLSDDQAAPFEILLDYNNRYPTNDIIAINANATSVVIPFEDTNDILLTTYGQRAVDAYGTFLPSFSITHVQALSYTQYQLTLSFSSSLTALFGVGPFGLTEFGTGYQNLISDNFILEGYKIQDSLSNIFTIIEIIDNDRVIVETTSNTYRESFTFITDRFDTILTTPVFAGYFQGVYLVDNIGDGYHLNVTWHSARTTRPDYDLAYLIYYSTIRSDVFYEEPKLITQGRKLPLPETIHGADAQLTGFFAEIPLPVGISYYFGVRATEFPHSITPIVPSDGYDSLSYGLTAIDGYSFAIPAPQILMTSLSGSGTVNVPVTSVVGFSRSGGYITVGSEVMRYSSIITVTISGPINVPGFSVPSMGRGLFGTIIQSTHRVGEYVRMYYGNKDDNTVIAKNLVSWEPPYDPHQIRQDLVTTNLTLQDGYNTSFEPFDFCGYHRDRPDLLFTDSQCNSYLGGEYNGHRGLSLTERLLANEETLLEVTGEPVILLKRIWQGEMCICRTSRKDSSKVRSCAICFGCGFKGGYVQYNNSRRNDRRIMVHFSVNDEEIKFAAQGGIEQSFKPNAWTLSVPSVIDRDILIKFDRYDKNKLQWIYVINQVSKGETVFGSPTRQKMNISRIDRTDVLYTYRIIK